MRSTPESIEVGAAAGNARWILWGQITPIERQLCSARQTLQLGAGALGLVLMYGYIARIRALTAVLH